MAEVDIEWNKQIKVPLCSTPKGTRYYLSREGLSFLGRTEEEFFSRKSLRNLKRRKSSSRSRYVGQGLVLNGSSILYRVEETNQISLM